MLWLTFKKDNKRKMCAPATCSFHIQRDIEKLSDAVSRDINESCLNTEMHLNFWLSEWNTETQCLPREADADVLQYRFPLDVKKWW